MGKRLRAVRIFLYSSWMQGREILGFGKSERQLFLAIHVAAYIMCITALHVTTRTP